jgi:hypothetical protein
MGGAPGVEAFKVVVIAEKIYKENHAPQYNCNLTLSRAFLQVEELDQIALDL